MMKQEIKLRSIRLSDDEYASVKLYVKSLRDGTEMPAKTIIKETVKEVGTVSDIPQDSPLHTTTANEQQFLEKGLKWFRAMISLTEVGAISDVPNPFTQGIPKSPRVESSPVSAAATADKPAFGRSVTDFLSGLNQKPVEPTVSAPQEIPEVEPDEFEWAGYIPDSVIQEVFVGENLTDDESNRILNQAISGIKRQKSPGAIVSRDYLVDCLAKTKNAILMS